MYFSGNLYERLIFYELFCEGTSDLHIICAYDGERVTPALLHTTLSKLMSMKFNSDDSCFDANLPEDLLVKCKKSYLPIYLCTMNHNRFLHLNLKKLRITIGSCGEVVINYLLFAGISYVAIRSN